jgi:hypothetical protein
MNNIYWEYAGTRYKTKFKAIEASGGDIMSITFNAFNDDFYSYPWHIEPKESYEQLLTDRALQLRDNYKYIKLFFSGGHDSTLMLNTFLNNNIHIDEIIVYRYAINDKFTNLSNEEIDAYAIPFLKNLQKQLPKTKITEWDFGKDFYDKYLGEKWLHTKSNFDMRHFNLPKIRGKNFCYLLGSHDPHVIYNEGKWYSDIFDSNGMAEVASFRNVEFFYTSPSFPALHAKQLHLVKNYLKYNNLTDVSVNTIEYKNIIRHCARQGSIMPTVSIRDKAKEVSMLDNPKTKHLLSKATTQQKDTLYSLLSTKVNNKSLVRLLRGYVSGTLDLGD